MQDTLLRVVVVSLSLLLCPRDDPGIEEWHDITTVDVMQKHERLLRGEKLEHGIAPVNQEIAQNGNGGPQNDAKITSKEQNQHVTEKDEMSMLGDVTIRQEGDGVDHKLREGILNLRESQKSRSEPEPAQKTSETDHEGEKENSRAGGRPQEQQEKEMFNFKEQESPPSHVQTETSENETSENAITDWEKDYLWYIWNMLSIFSMMRFFKKVLEKNPQMKQEQQMSFLVTCNAAEVPLPDSNTLRQFHSKCVQVSSDKWREEEFLEGFVNDLIDTMKKVCHKNGGMVIEDFEMGDTCDITIPFSPPEPYKFQCLLWNNQASDVQPDMQVCGQIKLVENKVQNGCPCQSGDADDMVCLLHCNTEKVTKITDVCKGLCMKNSSFLSKTQVTRWFQSTIKQAWALVSNKYDFELNIRYIDAPGALAVRFRSGRKICFSMKPVIRLKPNAHFFVTPGSPSSLDTFWTLSLTSYEDRFFEHIAKQLPDNSCHIQTLEIAHFLLKRQTALSGSSALRYFHFKTALMHLLLTKDQLQWKPNYMAARLRDLLVFMEKSLERKLLHHVLIGNPSIQRVLKVPAEFTQAKKVNLFHPLVVHNCIYRNTVVNFQEMLQNTHMLIQDYVHSNLKT